MFNYLVKCLLYILPVLLSGLLFIFFLKMDYFNFLNKPIDFNNHGIDASRYLAIMKLGNKGTVRTFTSKPNLFR